MARTSRSREGQTSKSRETLWHDLVSLSPETTGSPGEILLLKAFTLLAPDLLQRLEREQQLLPKRSIRVDFVLRDVGLIIEIDGGQWLQRVNPLTGRVMVGGRHNRDADRFRNNDLVAHGWRIMHLTAEMLEKDVDRCMAQIRLASTMGGLK